MFALKTGAASGVFFRTFSSLHKPAVVRSLSNASFTFSPLSPPEVAIKRKSLVGSWNPSSSSILKSFHFQRHYSAKSLAEEVMKSRFKKIYFLSETSPFSCLKENKSLNEILFKGLLLTKAMKAKRPAQEKTKKEMEIAELSPPKVQSP